MSSKLVQLSKSYLLLRGNTTRNDSLDFVSDTCDIVVSIQNGNKTLFNLCKVNLSIEGADNHQRCNLDGIFATLIEISPDYASSIAVKEGFAEDTVSNPTLATSSLIVNRSSFTCSFYCSCCMYI